MSEAPSFRTLDAVSGRHPPGTAALSGSSNDGRTGAPVIRTAAAAAAARWLQSPRASATNNAQVHASGSHSVFSHSVRGFDSRRLPNAVHLPTLAEGSRVHSTAGENTSDHMRVSAGGGPTESPAGAWARQVRLLRSGVHSDATNQAAGSTPDHLNNWLHRPRESTAPEHSTGSAHQAVTVPDASLASGRLVTWRLPTWRPPVSSVHGSTAPS
jgi:hypothetical protein